MRLTAKITLKTTFKEQGRMVSIYIELISSNARAVNQR